ncbi:MAG: HAMP domain-containing sensor histidine kinase [Caldilineaceae bacterium]
MMILRALRHQLDLLPVRITLLFALIFLGALIYLQSSVMSYLQSDLPIILQRQSARSLQNAMSKAGVVLNRSETDLTNLQHYASEMHTLQLAADVATYDLQRLRQAASLSSTLPISLTLPTQSALNSSNSKIYVNSAIEDSPYLIAPIQLNGRQIGWQAMAVDLALQKTLQSALQQRLLAGILGTLALIGVSGVYLRSYSRRNIHPLLQLTSEIVEPQPEQNHQLTKLTGEFQQLGLSILQMKETLGQYESQRKLLVDRISHDISSPLATISMISNINIDDSLTELDQRDWETVYDATEQVRRLLEDMKYVVHQKLALLPVEKRPTIELGGVIERVVSYYQARYRGRKLNFCFANRTAGSPVCIRAERTRLLQLLGNLFDNALAHGKATAIEVTLATQLCPETQQPAIELQVKDNGVGIAPELLPTIFQPGVTTGGSKADEVHQPHRGLGLAIVADIVNTLEGKISVESQPNLGTIFRMHFPAQECGELPR